MNKEKSLFARRRIVVSRWFLCPLAAVFLVTESAWGERIPIGGFLFVAGCMLATVATIGRLWCSLYICGRKTRELVTCGPYSLTRNPLYFFSAIGVIGIGLATETLAAPVLLILLFAVAYPSVIRAEENKLREVHGNAYEAYALATPRFFPRFARYSEPDTYEVNPRKFRGALFDALWFVWLIGIVELAEAFREAGILPSLITVY